MTYRERQEENGKESLINAQALLDYSSFLLLVPLIKHTWPLSNGEKDGISEVV